MKPYLTIIKDSFRAAIVSRVMGMTLVAIGTILLALAPFTYEEVRTWELREHDIVDFPRIVAVLGVASSAEEASPVKTIWEKLDATSKSTVRDFTTDGAYLGQGFALRGDLVTALNGMIEEGVFSASPAFDEVELDKEGEELLAISASDRTEVEQRRLNRLLLEAALPGMIDRSRPTSIQVKYVVWDVGPAAPIAEYDFKQTLELVITGFVDWFGGGLAVLIAILVTAPNIPRLLRTGSIELLLSKPVTRAWLLLTEFVASCVFVLILVSFLMVGLWLILWTRFGMFEPKLLLLILVFVFLYAVYYSVTMLAGLAWRNTVISIAVTIMFWLACNGIGLTKTIMDEMVLAPQRINVLTQVDDELFAVDQAGLIHRWSAGEGDWVEISTPNSEASFGAVAMGASNMLGPVYAPERQQLLAIPNEFGGFSPFGMTTPILIIDRTSGWTAAQGPDTPAGTFGLFVDAKGNVVLAAETGLFRFHDPTVEEAPQPTPDPIVDETPPTEEIAPPPTDATDAEEPALPDDGEPLPEDGESTAEDSAKPPARTRHFEPAGIDAVVHLAAPNAAAMDRATGDVVVLGRGVLYLFRRDAAGNYAVVKKRDLDNPQAMGVLAFSGAYIIFANHDGTMLTIKAEDLTTHDEQTVFEMDFPVSATAADDGGRFAVIYRSHTLVLVEPESKKVTTDGVRGQGDISAATFVGDKLMVVDKSRRVTTYDAASLTRSSVLTPPMSMTERVHRWLIVPAYWVLPKQNELEKTITHIMLSDDDEDAPKAEDVEQAESPWWPVFSSMLFVAVILAWSCVKFGRADL